MTTNFPTSVDAFTNPTSNDTLDNPPHDQQHADINDAMEAVQTSLLDGSPLKIDDANNRVGIGTASPAVALDVVGTTDTDYLTVGGENVTPYTGRRNILYNGAMQVAQRGTSVSSQYVSGYYTVDRWQWFSNATGARWDMAQDTDAPDGFSNSWKITCSQALASPASGDYYQVSQRLEGYDIQHLAKGLSNAKQVTLSFWVKSNVTGTYIARLLDQNNRAIHRSYTVNTVNTWEYKTLTYAGDTSGTITSVNTEGLRLTFWLGSGSAYNSGTLQTSWGSYVPTNSAVGNVNLASAVNNYWQITGVQLELGDKATPFEYRSFGEELALCERYYQVGSVVPQTSGNSGSYFQTTGSNNFGAINTVAFRTRMRTVPTMGWNFTSTDNAAVTQYYVNQDSCGIRVIANNTGFLYCSYYASFGASAEL